MTDNGSPSVHRRRSGTVMILTMVGWHAVPVALLSVALLNTPIEPSCEFACRPGDRLFFGLLFLAIPLAISLVVSELLIVAQVRGARRAALDAGQQPAPASRWRDAKLATAMTLAGMLSSAAGVGAYLTISRAL